MKSIVKKIIIKLKKKRLTLSVAESCTGGLLSSYLTSISGSSKVYKLGLVVYSNKSKNKLLKVSKNNLLKYGAVSEQTCISMVKNLSKLASTDIAVSITGIAGPSGGTSTKPVGLIFIGIKTKKKILCRKFIIRNKGRIFIQKEAVKKTFKLISALIK